MESTDRRDDQKATDTQDRNSSKPRLSSAMEQAQKTASAATDGFKDRARDAADQQKTAGAEQIGGVARAMQSAADELKGQMPLAAEFIDDMATRLDGLASTLRERSVDDMLGRAAQFARQQPAVFFAGAVATGFALSRFAANRKG